ncbi:SDR family NAD(P)-dependent oxidoreductase [bacterium]|nr:SDR family NAD(P)-dependent oxidoreductase [bacterium]
MNQKFSNCVITGVSGATGSAIRSRLLENGATVIGSFRSTHDTQELLKIGSNDYQIGMNPKDPSSIKSAINIISQELHQIHVWINVVGGFEMGSAIEDYPAEVWERMWSLNYLTVLNSTQAIIPHFKLFQTGRLINFGSAAVADGMPYAGPYLVSKAAVQALTKATAAELKGDITCNAILPTIIDTPTNRNAMPDADYSEWVTPESIATQVISFISNISNGRLIRI